MVQIFDDLLHISKKIDYKHAGGTEILLFRIKTEDNMLAVNRVFVTIVRGSGYPRVPCLRKQLPPHTDGQQHLTSLAPKTHICTI